MNPFFVKKAFASKNIVIVLAIGSNTLACETQSVDKRRLPYSSDLLRNFVNTSSAETIGPTIERIAGELNKENFFKDSRPRGLSLNSGEYEQQGLISGFTKSLLHQEIQRLRDKNINSQKKHADLTQNPPSSDDLSDYTQLEKGNCTLFLENAREIFRMGQDQMTTSMQKLRNLDLELLKREISEVTSSNTDPNWEIQIQKNNPNWALGITAKSTTGNMAAAGYLNFGANADNQQFASEFGFSMLAPSNESPFGTPSKSESAADTNGLPSGSSNTSQMPSQGTTPKDASYSISGSVFCDAKAVVYAVDVKLKFNDTLNSADMGLNVQLTGGAQPTLGLKVLASGLWDGVKVDKSNTYFMQRVSDREFTVKYSSSQGVFDYKVEQTETSGGCKISKIGKI